MWLRDVPGVLTAEQQQGTAGAIAAWQLPSGMIPWFPGGHADPWNHTEAAMALSVAGLRSAAELAYDWLLARQRPDGAWHRYETAVGVEEDKLDANVCAYPATGVWHHWLCFPDRGFAEAMFPMVDRAMQFVLGLQTPRGEILWARHSDGTPWPFALLTGSSSISLSLRCALALAAVVGVERPAWQEASDRLLATIQAHAAGGIPDAFAPKQRWAMDWYYPVLVGALPRDAAVARLAGEAGRFILDDRGVRCVADQPWITAAETCECAMAYLRVGDDDRALALFRGAAALRDGGSGHYWTGRVYPATLEPIVNFPAEERSTYTDAAVLLCADALTGASPAAGLFTGATLPAEFDARASEGRH